MLSKQVTTKRRLLFIILHFDQPAIYSALGGLA
jgi:hypothetical protein